MKKLGRTIGMIFCLAIGGGTVASEEVSYQLVEKNEIYEIEIERDGSILIPNIGKIVLSGLSFDQASKLIKEKYQIRKISLRIHLIMLKKTLNIGLTMRTLIFFLNGMK